MVCNGLISQNIVFQKIEYDYYAGKIAVGDFISTTSSAFEYCAKQHCFTSTDVEASVLVFKIREDYSDYDEKSEYNGHYGYNFYIVVEVISTYDYEEDKRYEPLHVTSCDIEEFEELDELEEEIFF